MTSHSWGEPVFSDTGATFIRNCKVCGLRSDRHSTRNNPELKVDTFKTEDLNPGFDDCDFVVLSRVLNE